MGSRADLIQAVADAINREDVIENGIAARWVKKATARLNQELRILEMTRHVVMPISSPKFVVPVDYVAVHAMKLNSAPTAGAVLGSNVDNLIYQPPFEISQHRFPGCNDRRPKYYTVHGREFEFAPFVTGQQFQIDLRYYAELTALSSDTDTNYILEKFPDLYEKAMLVYGFRHTMEFDASDKMAMDVSNEIAMLNTRKENQKYGDGPLIIPPAAHRLGGRHS